MLGRVVMAAVRQVVAFCLCKVSVMELLELIVAVTLRLSHCRTVDKYCQEVTHSLCLSVCLSVCYTTLNYNKMFKKL